MTEISTKNFVLAAQLILREVVNKMNQVEAHPDTLDYQTAGSKIPPPNWPLAARMWPHGVSARTDLELAAKYIDLASSYVMASEEFTVEAWYAVAEEMGATDKGSIQ